MEGIGYPAIAKQPHRHAGAGLPPEAHAGVIVVRARKDRSALVAPVDRGITVAADGSAGSV
jgi:hypothetical protein